MGAVDASEHQQLGGRFGVKGFPAIKIFGEDKKKPTDYTGEWVSRILPLSLCMSCNLLVPFAPLNSAQVSAMH